MINIYQILNKEFLVFNNKLFVEADKNPELVETKPVEMPKVKTKRGGGI